MIEKLYNIRIQHVLDKIREKGKKICIFSGIQVI